MQERNTVGCDVGDRYSHVCVLDEGGTVIDRGRVRTTRAGFETWFGGKARVRVVIEVGAHSRWINELLLSLGHEVVVANPRKVQLIAKSQHKTDRHDAELLARLGRVDQSLLSPVRHRGAKAHADLVALRTRDVLVRERARLMNHLRGIVKAFGERPPSCTSIGFTKRVAPCVPQELRASADGVLRLIDALSAEIKLLERHLAKRTREEYPEAKRLEEQAPGVGPITSLAYVLTIEDPTRFRKSRMVGAYVGLTTGRDQSGRRDPEKRITKCGDPLLRRLLVNCAQHVLQHGPDSDLRRWGLALASRGKKNAKKRAVVAVARKLAVLLHRLWITGERYQPLRSLHAAAA